MYGPFWLFLSATIANAFWQARDLDFRLWLIQRAFIVGEIDQVLGYDLYNGEAEPFKEPRKRIRTCLCFGSCDPPLV
jgi:hypothetical protein